MSDTQLPYQSWRSPVDRLRGMADADPESLRLRQAVQDALLQAAGRHGYQRIDTPVLEHTELFLRKSGGERVAQMYAFNFRDREIALRPEFTSSVLRHYVDSLQSAPLPVRLSYAGPVFRYERPQAGRSRQFTDVGVELIGASGSQADAEVIHLALEGLASVGIQGNLVLGHIGIVLDFLNRIPMRQRARDWLIWSMERLRKDQPVDIDTELPGLAGSDSLPDVFHEMRDSLSQIPEQQLEQWVLGVLREVGVQMHGGTRSPEEIVSGVIAKMHQSSESDDVRRAFEFISELVAIRGEPATVLPELRTLLQRHRLDQSPIQEIEMTLELLSGYSASAETVELNLGLGRGLHYYTGILFEIYDPKRPWLQLCGGGRYDELAQSLGAREATPACGFSYGLERVVEASELATDVSVPDMLIMHVDGQHGIEAARAAERYRSEDFLVELDVRGRTENANRRYAQRRGIPKLVVIEGDGTERHVEVAVRTTGRAGGDT